PASSAAWRVRARVFAERVLLPEAEAIDATDRFPDGMVPQLADEGFLGVGLPLEHGGSGSGPASVAAVIEELAKGSAAVATLVSVHLAVCAQPIARFGSNGQKARYLGPLASGQWLGAFALTEPGAGSDAASIGCRYERTQDGGFRLDGTKTFITNAQRADVLLLFARRREPEGVHGISAFLLPKGTPGLTVARPFEKLGLHGSETHEVRLDGVRLPGDALLGEEGGGLAIALGSLASGRVGIAACALGVAQAAYDHLQGTVRSEPTDARRSVLARAFVQLLAARALVERAAERMERGEPFVAEAAAAKLAASEAAVQLSSTAVELGGPAAARSSSPAQRLWRDARVFPIVEGTTEIQEMILGRSLLGP
ncbi:MAG TPA: acyl-CoA dehydrogenase family protein, partial [Thermoplasmata archaeon]|nr:acyl-CoA dehydrogenase family protein [Thermoplasmata archaeon]